VLRTLSRVWLLVARKIGHFQSWLIFVLIYFVVIAPFALAVRIFKDPLNLRGGASWHWFSQDDRPTLDWVKRQF
jgi:TRAP-type mannitol/chloroaromatic compound transport system permease small subunit